MGGTRVVTAAFRPAAGELDGRGGHGWPMPHENGDSITV